MRMGTADTLLLLLREEQEWKKDHSKVECWGKIRSFKLYKFSGKQILAQAVHTSAF